MSPEMSDALVLGGVAAAVALAGACVVGAVRRVRKRAPPPAAAASSAPSSSVVVDDGVGILALETYFPSRYVEQTAMEVQDGCAGKYTKGLGQRAMAFVDDREDVNSICLSAAVRLLDRYGIDRSRIGRVEVGTETLVDKSKSAKTVLMQLFEHGDVEGVTCVNACYGGTAALFNTLAWARSAECRGRLGLVVAADIAVYAPGNARATGGCGAVAILVGAGAPLVVECGTRASHAEHVWDFFKPCMASEYPVVDGKLSQSVYMRSFDRCMESFHANSAAAGVVAEPDFYVFHAPYNKLVQKTFGRIAYQRFLQNPDAAEFASIAPETRAKLRSISLVDSYASRDVDLAFRKHSAEAYAAQVVPSTLLPREIGNCYTASLYAGLVSLVSEAATNDALPSLLGKRVCMFSYGSGCVASTFALRVREGEGDFTLKRMASTIDLQARLEARTVQTVGEYTRALDCRRRLHDHLVHSTASAAAMQAFKGATPNGPLAHIPVGAFYLARVTENYQREYVVRTAAAAAAEAASPRSRASLPGAPTPLDLDALLSPGWNSTRVTGIAAGIPGRDRVFDRRTNVSTLLSGEPLIRALSDDAVQSVLARNPRRRTVTVSSDGTKTVTDVPLGSPENSLRVASTLGAFDLVAEYGIDARIVAGMEMTCQLAIAAAFEALLDAELVAGGGDWLLNENLRERTGIVCAASYAGVEASIDAAQSPTFDRKFLFKVLVPGAAQIAQLVGARGPCIQLNAACAGTTQAIAVAQVRSSFCAAVVATATATTHRKLLRSHTRALRLRSLSLPRLSLFPTSSPFSPYAGLAQRLWLGAPQSPRGSRHCCRLRQRVGCLTASLCWRRLCRTRRSLNCRNPGALCDALRCAPQRDGSRCRRRGSGARARFLSSGIDPALSC